MLDCRCPACQVVPRHVNDACLALRTTDLSMNPNLPAFPSPSPCLPQAAGLAAAPPAALSGNPVGAAAVVALHVVGRL